MKKAAGFTLIELVIVIVILGILGAVAAPRFLNLQGDAYAANVSALQGSMQTAATLASTKAVLGGFDAQAAAADQNIDGATIDFVFGYPAATQGGILAMLQDLDAGPEVDDAAADNAYTFNVDADAGTLTVWPSARFDVATCSIVYTQAANTTTPATVQSATDGC
ncbi:prepilin-type N-terminal cleavage/methylation domain-containing protein [Zobellella denitrificans]